MNTLGDQTYREGYRLTYLDTVLRSATVATKICAVDNSARQLIKSPYLSETTTTVQAIAGTYTVNAWTTNNDSLTVGDEFNNAIHIFDFEDTLADFDMYTNLMREQAMSVAQTVDKWVLNNLCEDGTGAYTTPAGGFTTASNVETIVANLLSKVAGYSEAFNGTYLVIEQTDIVGFILSGATSGFNFADAVMNNGFMSNYMGVDIYVVKTGTFVDATTTSASGTKTWTNSGHRVFGVKGVTTFAYPRGMKTEEKSVTGKTGKEVVVYGYLGFKAWTPKVSLTVDITTA